MEQNLQEQQNINALSEDTTGPNAPNIAPAEQNISIDQMFQQSDLPSLGRQVFSVQPVFTPTAKLFNIRRKPTTNDLEFVSSDANAFPSDAIKTDINYEAVEDARNTFGKAAETIIGNMLRGLANEQENTRTLEFLDTNSVAEPDLVLSNALNSETNLFEITQRVQELVLKINSKNLRSYEAFAILPFKTSACVMALNRYIGGDDILERGLFISKNGQTRYYTNPDAESNTAYVGIRDSENFSKSSAVFLPYASSIIESVDYETGDPSYHIFNRFSIGLSPLHDTGNEMLYKFNIV